MKAASLFRGLFSRFSHRRKQCEACNSADAKLLRLLKKRIAFEKRISELYARLPAELQLANSGPCFGAMFKVMRLRKYRLLTSGEAECIARNYKRASRIIHGEPLPGHDPESVGGKLSVLLKKLDDANGYRSYKGEPDYELRQLTEQFGDGILGNWGANAVVGFAGGAV